MGTLQEWRAYFCFLRTLGLILGADRHVDHKFLPIPGAERNSGHEDRDCGTTGAHASPKCQQGTWVPTVVSTSGLVRCSVGRVPTSKPDNLG